MIYPVKINNIHKQPLIKRRKQSPAENLANLQKVSQPVLEKI